MLQLEPLRMQRLALELGNLCGQRCVAASIHRVAEQGMTDRCEVHANLMRSSGVELAFEQRRRSEAFERSI
jgi:hypothetical protein